MKEIYSKANLKQFENMETDSDLTFIKEHMSEFFFSNLKHYTDKVRNVVLDPNLQINYHNAGDFIFESGISHR